MREGAKTVFDRRRIEACVNYRFFKGTLSACLLTIGLAGCDTFGSSYQPDVGPSQTPAVVAQVQKGDPQAALAARQRPQILARYGGEYKDAKTERLVARIEGALTTADENPQQSFRITILNSPTINAFAFPGGYLYVRAACWHLHPMLRKWPRYWATRWRM